LEWVILIYGWRIGRGFSLRMGAQTKILATTGREVQQLFLIHVIAKMMGSS
jgi:hypothetical protein